MEIFRLFGSILVNSDQADASLSRTDEHAEKVGGTLMEGIGAAAKWGIAIVGAAGAGAMALFGIASKASEAAANIDDVAQRTNLSAKTLQEFKHAAEMSGFSMDTIASSAVKLTATMGKYAEGNKGTIADFKQLELSAIGANGKLKSTDELFPQIIEKLAGMKDITERNTLAMSIFGKSALDMAPLLNGGAEGVKQLTDEAHKLGLVMSDESVSAGALFDDTLTQVKSSLGSLVTKIGIEVLPMAQTMLAWVTDHMPVIQAIGSTAFDVIGTGVSAVGGVINNGLIPSLTTLWGWIQPNIPAIKETFKTAFDVTKIVIDGTSTAIGVVIDWCIKFQDILIPLGAGIGAGALAFGIYTLAIKAATLAKTTWTTVTGLATAAGTAFGAVLAFITSPIGLVVIAIGLLVAAGVLLYKNWDTVKSKATEIFGAIGKFIGGVTDGIKSGFKGMVNGVISGLNFMVNALNKLKFTVPEWIPGIGGKGFGFNIPNIPSFAVGTRYLPQDMLIQAHKGEMIVPEKENPYANSGGSIIENDNGTKAPTILQLVLQNGKVIAEYIIDDIDKLMGNKNMINGRGVGIA